MAPMFGWWRALAVPLGLFGLAQVGLMASTGYDGVRTTGEYREVTRFDKDLHFEHWLKYHYEVQGRRYSGTAGSMRPRPSASTGALEVAYSPRHPWFSYPVGMAGEKLGFGLLALAAAVFILKA